MATSQQQKIIAALHTSPTIDVALEIEKRIAFIKHSLKSADAKSLVLGLSSAMHNSSGIFTECRPWIIHHLIREVWWWCNDSRINQRLRY